MLQMQLSVAQRNTQVGGCSSWVKIIFQDWYPFQSGKIKKVTFLLFVHAPGLRSAPVLSAGEQAGAVSAHQRSGLTPAGVSRSAGGQRRRRHSSGRPTAGGNYGGNARGRKIL